MSNMRNWVAKNMHNYNRPSVVPDKRQKHLDDLAEREAQYEPELDEEWDEDDRRQTSD